MTDALMTVLDQQEALSLVYAQAVAARAGYITEVPRTDRDSVDLCIRAGGRMRPVIDLQLKATVNLERPRDGFLHFHRASKIIMICVLKPIYFGYSWCSICQKTNNNG